MSAVDYSSYEDLLNSPPPLDAPTRAEFEDDFLHTTEFAIAARRRAKHGLRQSRLRSVHWRIFLGLIDSADISRWLNDLVQRRDRYDALLKQFMVTPSSHEHDAQQRGAHFLSSHDKSGSVSPSSSSSSSSSGIPLSDLSINNPLSTAENSVWHQYFTNSELCNTIMLDIKRTHPESPFFADESIQSLMLNVLFVWAKLHPQYEYRQGMNELLATVVVTVFRDTRKVTVSHAISTSPVGVDGTALLSALLDRHYAEHDVFHLFQGIMGNMSPFFAKVERPAASPLATKSSSEGDILVLEDKLANSTDSSPIINKCNHIHHTLLSQLDPPLYKHLNVVDVQPQLYALRWYRLLFSREFHMEDVRFIWDVLFSQNAASDAEGFLLAEFMCVAMLYYVRQQLLNGDNTSCLKRLLKFPPVEDVRVLVDRALHFHNTIRQQHHSNHNSYDDMSTSTQRIITDDPLGGSKSKFPSAANAIRRSNSAQTQSAVRNANASQTLTINSSSPSPSSTPLPPLSPQTLTSHQLVALDMSEELNQIILRMSHELERCQKQRALNQLVEGERPSAGEWSGAEFSLQLVMTSIAQVKHVREVLSGRLAYQPQSRVGVEVDDHIATANGALSPAATTHNTAATASSSSSISSSLSSSPLFFVPKTTTAPAERLAKIIAGGEKAITVSSSKPRTKSTMPISPQPPLQQPLSASASESLFEKKPAPPPLNPKLNHLIGEQTATKSVFD